MALLSSKLQLLLQQPPQVAGLACSSAPCGDCKRFHMSADGSEDVHSFRTSELLSCQFRLSQRVAEDREARNNAEVFLKAAWRLIISEHCTIKAD